MPKKTVDKKNIRSLESKGFYSDCQKDGALTAVLIRSPAPTGQIKNIYINDLPEGYFLFTAEDIPGSKTLEINNNSTPIFGYKNVSYYGEPLGILVGPDDMIVQDLIKKVNINFKVESLESAFHNVINQNQKDSESELSNIVSELNEMPSLDTVLDNAQVAENTEEIIATREIKSGLWKTSSTEEIEENLFGKADHVTTENWSFEQLTPSWQETSGAFCYMEGKKLHIHAPSRWTYQLMNTISKLLNLPVENIYVHKTKSPSLYTKGLWRTTQLAAQVALACYLTKKPVKLVLSQKEQDTFMAPSVNTNYTYRTAIDKTGRIKGMEVTIDIDTGSFNPFAQEITDRLAISACNYYQPENIHITAKCHTSKNPPTSINIKSLDSLSFFAIENQMQQLSTVTKLFPSELREKNTNCEKSDFPFNFNLQDYSVTFENTIKRSDFNRKYASFQMSAIDRIGKDNTPFFALPLRGIGIASAYNISSYYGNSYFNYDSKIQVTLTTENKVVIHTIKPSAVIQDIWKTTAAEILQIKKENVIIDSDFDIEEIPTSPEDATGSITTINEIIKKCCNDIQKKRFHQPLPISAQKSLGNSGKKLWDKENFCGTPYGTTSFATTAVEVELDAYTYNEKIKGIWVTIDCGELLDKAAAVRTIRLEIQQQLSMLVQGKTIPCDIIEVEFVESKDKSGQVGELIHNTLPAAFTSALSLALTTQLTKLPCTEKELYTLIEAKEQSKEKHESEEGEEN